MSEENGLLEENVSRLIRVSFAREARPDPDLRQRTFESLLARLRAAAGSAREFPDVVLVALVAVLGALGLWRAIDTPLLPLPMAGWVLSIVASLLYLNLAGIPIACVVIVLRRRHG